MYNSHEDSEATETTDTEVTPVDIDVDDSAATEEPVEAVEAAPEAEAEATPEEIIPDIFEWNGEVSGLKDSEWFSGLEDNLKQSLLKGFETKYNHWQRGYTDKFNEMSQLRKKLDSREKDVRKQEVRVQRWLKW